MDYDRIKKLEIEIEGLYKEVRQAREDLEKANRQIDSLRVITNELVSNMCGLVKIKKEKRTSWLQKKKS